MASASIGQVYKGVLLTGEEVVVKVQRPNIREKIKLDLVLMKILAKRAIKAYPGLAHFNVVGFVEDFGDNIMKELDYTNEASNMKRFAVMFKDDETCYIPVLFLNILLPNCSSWNLFGDFGLMSPKHFDRPASALKK
jgi:ubiquinone biosynthesis protein